MSGVLVLIPCTVLGVVGWFIYHYPVQTCDFVVGKDPGHWRPVGFLRLFGILLMCLAGLSVTMAVAAQVLRVLR